MEWKPTTIEQVKEFVKADLANCDELQAAVFRQHAVDPYLAPILRYGNLEHVVVVARRANEVIYWEDVEEGFEVSLLGPGDTISEAGSNQDKLGLALNRWIEGRGRLR